MFKMWLPVMAVLGALPVGATTTFYVGTGGESSFLAATGSLSFTNSFSIDGTGFIGTEAGTGLDFNAFTNNNTSAELLTINGGKLAKTASTGTILVDVNVTAYAIGLYVKTTQGSSFYCIEAPGASACFSGGPDSASVDTTANVFFGVISDTPITDFQLRRDGGNGRLSIVSAALVSSPLGGGGTGGDPGGSETPEPSSMALMGGALCAIPLLARRRRQN
jgi:hypothetical protein